MEGQQEKGEIYECQQVVDVEKNLTTELKKGSKSFVHLFSLCWCLLFLEITLCLMYTLNKHVNLT